MSTVRWILDFNAAKFTKSLVYTRNSLFRQLWLNLKKFCLGNVYKGPRNVYKGPRNVYKEPHNVYKGPRNV